MTTRFNLGERVWKIEPDTETINLPCRACRGRGFLDATGANGEARSVKCPDCYSNGGATSTVRLGSWPQWRVRSELLTIGMIQLRVIDRSGADNGEPFDNTNPAKAARMNEDEENYMCWETGVGSGSVHHVEDLFGSREDAQLEAEARTERARRGEEPGGRKQWARWWPDAEQVRVAAGFLDHRDIYEHDAGHVALAEAIVAAGASKP